MTSTHIAESVSPVVLGAARVLRIVVIAVSSPRHYTLWNSLAAESLAGDLRGHFAGRVKLLVLRVRNEKERCSALRSVADWSPEIVGVSVECGGVELAGDLVKELPLGTPVNDSERQAPALVFGGKIPTYFPDFFLTKFPASVVVVGEGEVPLRRLVQRHLSSAPEDLSLIPNLAYIDEAGQSVRTTAKQPSSSDLVYPPSTDTVPELLAMGAGTLMTQASRGCSWSKCSYCTIPSFRGHKKWESLPWTRTKRHLESLVALGVREFEFCDDEFLGGRDPEHLERARAIASDMATLGKAFENGIAFRIFLIPHSVFRSDDPAGNEAVSGLLSQLRAAGLVRVYFGVESGSEAQLRRYCRGTPLRDVVGALDTVKNLGLGIDCGFIMFDPLATIDNVAENIRFFRKHGLVEHNQWPFRPLVANQGAGIGQIMARLGMPPDPDYMCYRYKFRDQQVQHIFDIVEAISSETRSLFYALKVVSKTHFDPAAETVDAKRARDFVIENALIYLDLLENLLEILGQSDAGRRIEAAALCARQRVMQLVNCVAVDIAAGHLRDPHNRLQQEIASLLPDGGLMEAIDGQPRKSNMVSL